MQYTNSFGAFLVATLAMADMAAAIPTANFRQHAPVAPGARRSTGGVSLKQVRNTNFSENHKNGALALEKIYLKFNTALPDDLSSAVSRIRTKLASGLSSIGLDLEDLEEATGVDFDDLTKKSRKARTTGSAVTTPETYDVEYLTPVQFGTPAQTLNLDLDTGSSDLWVYSSETPSSEINGQAVYNPSNSNTSEKQSSLSWSISYGDGSTSKGDVYYDTVSLGGLTVNDMAVEVATEVSSEFTADSNMDGLFGLGFSTLNTVSPKQQSTFFEKAKSQLSSFLFTTDLKAGERKLIFAYLDRTPAEFVS